MKNTMTTRVEWLRDLNGEHVVRAIGVSGFGADAHDAAIEAHFAACELALLGVGPCGSVAIGVIADGELFCFHDLTALEHAGAFFHFLGVCNEREALSEAA